MVNDPANDPFRENDESKHEIIWERFVADLTFVNTVIPNSLFKGADMSQPPPLYQVLQEKQVSVGKGMMGTSHVYDLKKAGAPGGPAGAGAPGRPAEKAPVQNKPCQNEVGHSLNIHDGSYPLVQTIIWTFLVCSDKESNTVICHSFG